MNTAIIGAGAVGLGLGSCLLTAGESVCFVVRSQPVEPLGLERRGIFGDQSFAADRFQQVPSIADLAAAPLDFILVCTKTFSARAVARDLARIWSSFAVSPRVVLVHNGWGSAEVFAAQIPAERVFNARVITGFRRTAPFQVDITVHADAIRLGSLYGAPLDALSELAERVQRGGIPCEVSSDIARDLWAKILYNCALNPLGALCGVPYGRLGEVTAYRRIMDSVVHEIFAVMQACGFRTHWSDPSEYLRSFYDEQLPPTARHESSMLQDIRAGRPTEIDALSGAIARLGVERGVPTPVNAALRDLVRATSQI